MKLCLYITIDCVMSTQEKRVNFVFRIEQSALYPQSKTDRNIHTQ